MSLVFLHQSNQFSQIDNSDVRVCALGKLKKLHLEGFLNYGGFGSFIYTSSFSGLVLSPLSIPGKPKSWISLSSEAEM